MKILREGNQHIDEPQERFAIPVPIDDRATFEYPDCVGSIGEAIADRAAIDHPVFRRVHDRFEDLVGLSVLDRRQQNLTARPLGCSPSGDYQKPQGEQEQSP